LVEQALIEISALKPEHQIFLVGTTNYLDRIDPRILRGGRFSEKVVVPVPDDAGYRKLVARYLGKARLGRELTVPALAERVTGMAPADLEATIQSMKRVAMRRMDPNAKELPPLNLAGKTKFKNGLRGNDLRQQRDGIKRDGQTSPARDDRPAVG
jgi:transitional endoplasmic reticulum ATPase